MSTVTAEKKNHRLVARVSKAHQQLFARAAAIEGRSVATFVVAHALEAANQLLAEQEIIRLDTEQSRRFIEALLAGSRPVPDALRRADADYKRRVVSPL